MSHCDSEQHEGWGNSTSRFLRLAAKGYAPANAETQPWQGGRSDSDGQATKLDAKQSQPFTLLLIFFFSSPSRRLPESLQPETSRYCGVCNRTIKYGHGGDSNWEGHEKSAKHIAKAKAAAGTRSLTSFFSVAPAPAAASSSHPHGTATAVQNSAPPPDTDVGSFTPNTASQSSQDVECLSHGIQNESTGAERLTLSTPSASTSVPNRTDASDERRTILTRLRSTISTLPLTIPVASDDDLTAPFAVDPTTLIAGSEDPWEDILHGILDRLMYDGGRSKNSLELSHSVRRGDLGMACLATWIEKCLYDINVPLGNLEPRIERIIQAMVLLGANETTESPPPSVQAVSPPEATNTDSSTPVPRGCPGQELPLKDGKSAFESYALGVHAARQLPWSVEFSSKLVVRSSEWGVTRDPLEPVRQFDTSEILRDTPRNFGEKKFSTRKIVPFLHVLAAQRPSVTFSTFDKGRRDALPHPKVRIDRGKTEQINDLKLAGLSLSRTLLVRATHLEAHSRLRMAIAKNDIPRIHSIVGNDLKQGGSIFATLENISRATNRDLNPKSYTHAEYQLLYLLLKLGGHAAAELGHRCLGLPSVRATKRHIATVPLIVSSRTPTMDEMQHNLDVNYPVAFSQPSDGSIGPGFQIMADEIKVEGRMQWDPRSNMILGVCREHSAKYDLEFHGIEQAEALHAGLAENKVHLASEGTVVAVNSFSDVSTRTVAHPFIIAPTCKRETADGRRRRSIFVSLRNIVRRLRSGNSLGPPDLQMRPQTTSRRLQLFAELRARAIFFLKWTLCYDFDHFPHYELNSLDITEISIWACSPCHSAGAQQLISPVGEVDT
ncbi:hypothetical protein R3P38DRAFT_3377681 [Favolaschia claudopus]|uniref:Uncharacterized protein n=1 Tax=Favolaschia claudopus TaxID=2862362 RepID=A0AAV9ZAK0_9AGAR